MGVVVAGYYAENDSVEWEDHFRFKLCGNITLKIEGKNIGIRMQCCFYNSGISVVKPSSGDIAEMEVEVDALRYNSMDELSKLVISFKLWRGRVPISDTLKVLRYYPRITEEKYHTNPEVVFQELFIKYFSHLEISIPQNELGHVHQLKGEFILKHHASYNDLTSVECIPVNVDEYISHEDGTISGPKPVHRSPFNINIDEEHRLRVEQIPSTYGNCLACKSTVQYANSES